MSVMRGVEDLRRILKQIDGRGYKSYKSIEGSYQFRDFALFVDHVQSDPFAPPSKVRVRVPQNIANLPGSLFQSRVRRIALEDFLARQVKEAIKKLSKGIRGTGKSGIIHIDSGGQEVLERTSLILTKEWVEARLEVGLPAAGRRVLGEEAEVLLIYELPRIVERGLFWKNLPQKDARRFVECVENQEYIRNELTLRGLIAFIGDGSILPRKSGVSDLPMPRKRAVPFKSPKSLRVDLPNPIETPFGIKNSIAGMGIPEGVTLIVGGGYHGKSTLLRALERGVYPHIPGDGREYVVSLKDTVKIRAEDGRRVEKVDISSFISNLPHGIDTGAFSTDDASGSTSQAANIVEYLEVGAKVLLLDEDTSATNFMIRDARMQALVSKENEPITPFLDRVRELYEMMGVSTVLVMGGSGDYFDVADTVIMMREFLPYEVTEEAKGIAEEYRTNRKVEVKTPFSSVTERIPLKESFDPTRGRGKIKIQAKSLDLLLFGRENLDLRYVEQLVDPSQTRAIGYALHFAARNYMDDRKTLSEILDELEEFFDRKGLDNLDPFRREGSHPGNFARPRRYELSAAINRLRSLRVKQRLK